MNSMMPQDPAHARVGLEEDSEEGLGLDGDLEALKGVASAIHAGEEVQDEVTNGARIFGEWKMCV